MKNSLFKTLLMGIVLCGGVSAMSDDAAQQAKIAKSKEIADAAAAKKSQGQLKTLQRTTQTTPKTQETTAQAEAPKKVVDEYPGSVKKSLKQQDQLLKKAQSLTEESTTEKLKSAASEKLQTFKKQISETGSTVKKQIKKAGTTAADKLKTAAKQIKDSLKTNKQKETIESLEKEFEKLYKTSTPDTSKNMLREAQRLVATEVKAEHQKTKATIRKNNTIIANNTKEIASITKQLKTTTDNESKNVLQATLKKLKEQNQILFTKNTNDAVESTSANLKATKMETQSLKDSIADLKKINPQDKETLAKLNAELKKSTTSYVSAQREASAQIKALTKQANALGAKNPVIAKNIAKIKAANNANVKLLAKLKKINLSDPKNRQAVGEIREKISINMDQIKQIQATSAESKQYVNYLEMIKGLKTASK